MPGPVERKVEASMGSVQDLNWTGLARGILILARELDRVNEALAIHASMTAHDREDMR
jgi:hypothetical protein